MKLETEYVTFLANILILYIKSKDSHFNYHCFVSFLIDSEQMIESDFFNSACNWHGLPLYVEESK